MSNQQSGRATFAIDGVDMSTKSGSSIDVGGPTREGMMTDQNQFRYKEKPAQCVIKGTLVHVASTDLPALRALKDFTVTFTLDIGTTYVSSGAAVMNVGELKDGECEIHIEGPPAEQV